MSNQIETITVYREDDQYSTYHFNWETGHLMAEHSNGYSENWSSRGYSIEAKAASFFLTTNQMDRYHAIRRKLEGPCYPL